jgi:hypothetical protein
MRMTQPRGDPALPQGALALLVGVGRTDAHRSQHLLDRHVPAQQLVTGQPDRAHPAPAELRLQAVPPRDEAAGRGHGSGHGVDGSVDRARVGVQTADGTPNRRAYSS